jgi:hypothetical protein
MNNTCKAEGAYAARTGELYINNPYPIDHEFYHAWAAGWINGAQQLQTELKVTRKAYAKAIDDRLAVEAQLKQVQAEYDAFLMEQGY